MMNPADAAGGVRLDLEVRFEAPDLSRKEAIRRHLAAGNPLLDTDGDDLIAVVEIGEIQYPHREAAEGELVWVCAYCQAYSVTKYVVDVHELTCDANPNRENVE